MSSDQASEMLQTLANVQFLMHVVAFGVCAVAGGVTLGFLLFALKQRNIICLVGVGALLWCGEVRADNQFGFPAGFDSAHFSIDETANGYGVVAWHWGDISGVDDLPNGAVGWIGVGSAGTNYVYSQAEYGDGDDVNSWTYSEGTGGDGIFEFDGGDFTGELANMLGDGSAETISDASGLPAGWSGADSSGGGSTSGQAFQQAMGRIQSTGFDIVGTITAIFSGLSSWIKLIVLSYSAFVAVKLVLVWLGLVGGSTKDVASSYATLGTGDRTYWADLDVDQLQRHREKQWDDFDGVEHVPPVRGDV